MFENTVTQDHKWSDKMKQYNLTVGRQDLRWLDISGNERATRGKQNYVFRSPVTDEAQRLIETNGFDGSYMRSLSTGHSETEWINLAMLSLAERYDGIVGVTLEGLASDRIAQSMIRLPTGRILYEILEDPRVFRASIDVGVEVPSFNYNYAAVDTWQGTFPGRKMRLVLRREDKSPNKQAERIRRNVYIELQPEFVANLGSVDMKYGPFGMEAYRAMTRRVKEEGLQPLKLGLVERIRTVFGA